MPEAAPSRSARPVVVGIDDTPAARAAAHAAVGLAGGMAVPVRLVHGFATPLPAWSGEDRELHRRAASLRLEQLRREVQAAAPGTPVTAVLRDGPASLVLLDEGHAASALVLGVPDGEAPGPVAAEVTARATRPVLLHRPGRAPGDDGGRVVVGVDGGPGTAALVAAAAAEAARRGSPLLVLHAWARRGELPLAGDDVTGAPAGDDPAVAAAERRLIDGYLGAVRTAPGQERGAVPVEVRIIHGDPVSCLAEAGRDAGLLVVGRHAGAARGSSRLAELARRCTASLLVVPLASPRPVSGPRGAAPAAGRPLAARGRPA